MAPAWRSAEGDAIRHAQLAERVAEVRLGLGPVAAQMDATEFEALVSVVTVLCTSETLGLLNEYLGLSGQQAGEAVAWAINQLIREYQQ